MPTLERLDEIVRGLSCCSKEELEKNFKDCVSTENFETAFGIVFLISTREDLGGPQCCQEMIRSKNYQIFQQSLNCEDSDLAKQIATLMPPEEIWGMIQADNFEGLFKAAADGNVDCLKSAFDHLIPSQNIELVIKRILNSSMNCILDNDNSEPFFYLINLITNDETRNSAVAQSFTNMPKVAETKKELQSIVFTANNLDDERSRSIAQEAACKGIIYRSEEKKNLNFLESLDMLPRNKINKRSFRETVRSIIKTFRDERLLGDDLEDLFLNKNLKALVWQEVIAISFKERLGLATKESRLDVLLEAEELSYSIKDPKRREIMSRVCEYTAQSIREKLSTSESVASDVVGAGLSNFSNSSSSDRKSVRFAEAELREESPSFSAALTSALGMIGDRYLTK